MCNIRRNKIYILYYLKQKEKGKKKKKKKSSSSFHEFSQHPLSPCGVGVGESHEEKKGEWKEEREEIGAEIERGNGLI